MERLYGTKRDREKVVRGLKKEKSPFIEGQDIFHNFVRTGVVILFRKVRSHG